MQDFLVPIVVSLIALCGTIIGVVVGYRKWAEEKRAERIRAFQADRQQIYKDLWRQVEQLNVDGRIEVIPPEEFSQRIAQINAFMLTSNVYLDDDDRSLVNSYLQAVRAFHDAVRSSEMPVAEVALGNTVDLPAEVLEHSKPLYESHQTALELRESLLKKIRLVVSGAE